MNINGINFESIVDGIGVRIVIYVSGCKHNCLGCHNPSTHSFQNGQLFDDELKNNIIKYINESPIISGITFSGGDPMFSANDVYNFMIEIKKKCKQINIWLYSGFLYEEILNDNEMNEVLKEINVLVDGKFELDKKSTILPFRGSSNQRIIDVQKSLKENKVILFEI